MIGSMVPEALGAPALLLTLVLIATLRGDERL